MDFYKRSQLPVLSFEKEPDTLDQEVIREVVLEKPCNVVFIEVQGKLAGIISRGDISRAKRAKLEKVPVNRSFTSVQSRQFMEAREIFREKKNINEIPMTDENGKLLGMCSRNDDLLYLEYCNPWKENRYIPSFLEKLEKIRFVRAPEGDARRRKLIERWITEFEKYNVDCELIDFSEIEEKQRDRTPILAVDEETCNGAAIVIESMSAHNQFRTDVVHTFRAYERTMSEGAYDELVGKLVSAGIRVYNMYFTEEENTEGRRRLWNGMRDWLERPDATDLRPYVMPSCAPGFFGELYSEEYTEKVGKLYFDMESNSVYTRMKDTQSRYLNIVNGERVTVGQPENADRTIWCFGPCFIIGGYVEDKYTIESILQERINREGYSCKVVNCGCYETPYQEMIHITSTPMKPGDIVVLHVANRPFENAVSVDMMEILDRYDVPCEWLLDLPAHCNHKVNRIYADELFARMVSDGVLAAEVDPKSQRALLSRALAVNTLFLDIHFDDFHPEKDGVYGYIGMHGNPFTLGHRYLIETASKQVDELICTIIEDDLGLFSYAERFAMAIEGTRDLPNVRIAAGGPFQATRNVFQEYFVRVAPTDIRESATVDTLIFTEIIAPRLGVTKRFLGDEKHNPKMQFFNELMKEILPQYCIEVIELPRAQVSGHSISASAAREAAARGDRETLLGNVPVSTLKFFIGMDDLHAAD